ncbi:hypothetical protein [Candidatus Uabimicrobium amorphum]|uniref:Uncharacterized protein n=1 Tax=Uabimicrobium amorphum TaxID=2596890 RepID=A0A5S9ISA7_UABAM|nr:hypothetical protein [Candidatus Uabimicrobium amorphum]BBM86994.1 hypothetical protein UABAM_05396 [Candidatus Uabimicrobium amorphum]
MKIYDTGLFHHFKLQPLNTEKWPAVFAQDFITSHIEKRSWDDNVTSIEGWRHLLIVHQTPEVHQKINNFLFDLHQRMTKDYQRINVWISVGKSQYNPQRICAFTTSNSHKVVLKSGELVMGNTPEDITLRRDIVRGYSKFDKLKDHIDKRKSWELSATPLIKNNTIEVEIDWIWRDKDTFKRHFKISVQDEKTALATSLTPNLNLYVGASIVK